MALSIPKIGGRIMYCAPLKATMPESSCVSYRERLIKIHGGGCKGREANVHGRLWYPCRDCETGEKLSREFSVSDEKKVPPKRGLMDPNERKRRNREASLRHYHAHKQLKGKSDTDSAVKICLTCKKNKPKHEFYRDTCKKDGLRHYCKDCDRAIRAKNLRQKESGNE